MGFSGPVLGLSKKEQKVKRIPLSSLATPQFPVLLPSGVSVVCLVQSMRQC